MAVIGFCAISGQIVAYTWMARFDEAGTSERKYQRIFDGTTIQLYHPNTWKVLHYSNRPEYRLVAEGPQGSQVIIVGSSVLLSAVSNNKSQRNPLFALHLAFGSVLRECVPGAIEASPARSNALNKDSVVSSFRADFNETHFRGFRFTFLHVNKAWTLIAVCRSSQWRHSLPVLKKIVQSIEVS